MTRTALGSTLAPPRPAPPDAVLPRARVGGSPSQDASGAAVGVPLAIASVALGFALFAALSIVLPAPLPASGLLLLVLGVGLAAVALLAAWLVSRRSADPLPSEAVAISGLIVGGTVIVLAAAYQIAAYIALPVDLLNWAESPFLNKIIRLRVGAPFYTPAGDNDANPYPPGAELLAYLVASAFGRSDVIPFYRVLHLSYVVLAVMVGTSVVHYLARLFLSSLEYRARPLWITFWALFLFLVAIEPRFNAFVFSLHNDGLALLVSACAFWLIVRHAYEPRGWLLVGMAVLPALGFMVKQNQLVWAGLFAFYLLVAGNVTRRQLVLFVVGSVACVAATVGIGYLIWGQLFIFWTFQDLRQLPIIVPRSISNLLSAGLYVIMGLVSGWILLRHKWSRAGLAVWLAWVLAFGIQAYTSGFAFLLNHLGPPVFLGACWLLVALVKLWSLVEEADAEWQRRVQQAVGVGSILLLIGGLGAVREPRNPIPDDFFRYAAQIEGHFQQADPAKVLLDTGTWVYLRENTLMKDRSAPAALRAGHKDPALPPERLAATIERIEAKTYDKILARQLDTPHSWYDFQDHGSGVKAAILRNYQVVDRIPAVDGIQSWWPEHLVSEVLVLVPRSS